jgi:hypothetical protein
VTVSLIERILVEPWGFGLETATPVQRAICRAIDGVDIGELWDDTRVQAAFGGTRPAAVRPLEVVIAAAIRGAKSMIAAAAAVAATQTVSLKPLKRGAIARVPIVATHRDEAGEVFRHLCTLLQGELGGLALGPPKGDTILLQGTDSRAVELKVTAISRAGSTLVARWLAGCIFDEAPRMAGEVDGVLNLQESQRAIRGRMLPGAQVLYPGSPWAPRGPVYELVRDRFGKPGPDVVVIRATGPDLNPSHWTPEACETERLRDERAYRCNVLAEFADASDAAVPSEIVERAARKTPDELPPVDGVTYEAAMDPGMRTNAWTLIVLACYGQHDYRVALARQWKPKRGSPLNPREVLGEIAELLLPYGVTRAWTDQHQYDALAVLAGDVGLSLTPDPERSGVTADRLDTIRQWLEAKWLELPPNRTLIGDVIAARRKPTVHGRVTVYLEETADGRHCDYVPSLALACAYPPATPKAKPIARDDDEMRRIAFEGMGRSSYDQAMRRLRGAA